MQLSICSLLRECVIVTGTSFLSGSTCSWHCRYETQQSRKWELIPIGNKEFSGMVNLDRGTK